MYPKIAPMPGLSLLQIDDPEQVMDHQQDQELRACEARRAEILELMQKHHVVMLHIQPWGRGNYCEEDNSPVTGCEMRFNHLPEDGARSALNLMADMEKLVGFWMHPMEWA